VAPRLHRSDARQSFDVTILAGIPVKGFATAKGRLSSVMDSDRRARLAAAIASRAIDAARDAGFDVVVVTGSDDVRAWARDAGTPCIDEPFGGGLDAAAAAITDHGSPWCVIHADLPLLSPSDLMEVAPLLDAGRAVLAPSRDGGTNLFAAAIPIRFSYGPGSFARHLAAAAAASPVVLVSPGLAVEIDTAADLLAASHLDRGAWLTPYLS
jgi:2-phospho-L-lactate/phosphoenolpyruvate guanylyltransferase